MDTHEQQHFNLLYEQHLTNLALQGKRPATIDAYNISIRGIAAYFDSCPDNLTTADLKRYFADLIASHSWSTVKLDRNGCNSSTCAYPSRWGNREVRNCPRGAEKVVPRKRAYYTS
ncbi:phage integrase N-terminal SAM-like domain-containing protein [Shewanella mangrovisoli]|uniref:phage integrase N-terminal SAM-like domain-containing protein n=1 Tax=Shewanella mangrovisoli TaxID=2864211 RepID=UPI0035B8BC79